MTDQVRDAHPPAAVAGVLNAVLRLMLGSVVGRLIGGLAMLEFAGRRTGRRYRIVVGLHQHRGDDVVFTPAGWRGNFADGWPAQVRHRGRSRTVTGVLETDPAVVAQALNDVMAAGTSPRALGMQIPRGHSLSAADTQTLGRALIRLG